MKRLGLIFKNPDNSLGWKVIEERLSANSAFSSTGSTLQEHNKRTDRVPTEACIASFDSDSPEISFWPSSADLVALMQAIDECKKVVYECVAHG